MKIEFTITNSTVELLSNTDTGDNTLIINGVVIPESSWTGTGYYTVDGISIKKIADTSGNIFCNKISATEYELNREIPTTGGGHIILNENGSAMPQRSKLQFENCDVTDDSSNDKTVVTASEGMAFVIANRTLTFSNNVATVSDSRVTANTYATVYFHDGSLASAVNAGLSIDTSSGVITITADSTPSSTLTCDIVCESGTGGGSISHQIAELRDDVDSLDTLMGNTDISSIGNGTATGAISTINSNLSDVNLMFPKYNNAAYFNQVGQYITPTTDQYIIFVANGSGDFALSVLVNNNQEIVVAKTLNNEYISFPFIARKNKPFIVNTTGSVTIRIIV